MRPPTSCSVQLNGLLFIFLAVPSSLFAQAWLSPKGEGSVSLDYQNTYIRDHVFSKGEAQDIGHIFRDALIMSTDYSLTDRVALTIGLPYIAAKYSGLKPHQLPIDNGTYNQTLQDFRVDVRYNLSKQPVVITPFFEAVIPSHSYPYFAHAAVGVGLREYHVGTNIARRLDPVLSNAYFQVRYSYAFVESVVGIAPNRSDTDFQFGYFLTPRFSLLGMGSWLHTHSGVDFRNGLFHGGLPDDQFPHHDQISKASLLDVGVGVTLGLSRSLDMSASVMHSLRGTNGHLHAALVTVGLSWSFRTRFAADRTSAGILTGSASAVESAH